MHAIALQEGLQKQTVSEQDTRASARPCTRPVWRCAFQKNARFDMYVYESSKTLAGFEEDDTQFWKPYEDLHSEIIESAYAATASARECVRTYIYGALHTGQLAFLLADQQPM